MNDEENGTAETKQNKNNKFSLKAFFRCFVFCNERAPGFDLLPFVERRETQQQQQQQQQQENQARMQETHSFFVVNASIAAAIT